MAKKRKTDILEINFCRQTLIDLFLYNIRYLLFEKNGNKKGGSNKYQQCDNGDLQCLLQYFLHNAQLILVRQLKLQIWSQTEKVNLRSDHSMQTPFQRRLQVNTLILFGMQNGLFLNWMSRILIRKKNECRKGPNPCIRGHFFIAQSTNW